MTPRTLGILVACGFVALAGGWYFGTRTEPNEQTTEASAGKPAFPDLASKLKDIAKIEITHQDTHTVIEKRPQGSPGGSSGGSPGGTQPGGGWGVAAMHDYPVQETKLRGLLTGLTELRLSETRTSNPAEFARLGVDDPAGKNAAGNLVQVMDAAGKPIAELIVGHRKVRAQGDLPDQVYVRRPGEDQSWLADGNLQVDADPAQWLDRSIMNIGHDRIASVVVGDKALVFGLLASRFALIEPADHPKLEDYKVEDVARALEMLSFQQVRADADAPKDAAEAGHAVFTTNDGLAVTATVLHAGKDVWARFSATGSDKTKAEADALNGRLGGWVYEIGSWKEKSLVPTLDDLKAPEPAPAAQSSAGPPKSDPATPGPR
ncbi:MAG TPA: DUF4340 domain-containing protein [Rhodopila sp.]|nr:DUF4340 domain-containing protein [Rhodopila sp.]